MKRIKRTRFSDDFDKHIKSVYDFLQCGDPIFIPLGFMKGGKSNGKSKKNAS